MALFKNIRGVEKRKAAQMIGAIPGSNRFLNLKSSDCNAQGRRIQVQLQLVLTKVWDGGVDGGRTRA